MRSFAMSWFACVGFWSVFVSCLDAPVPDLPPAARVVTAWDPRACGDPHRVAVELEDDFGVLVTGSAPCERGSVALDVVHFGVYEARVYPWSLEAPTREIALSARLPVDQAIVHWSVQTP